MSICISNKTLGKLKPLCLSQLGLRFKIENLRWDISIYCSLIQRSCNFSMSPISTGLKFVRNFSRRHHRNKKLLGIKFSRPSFLSGDTFNPKGRARCRFTELSIALLSILNCQILSLEFI